MDWFVPYVLGNFATPCGERVHAYNAIPLRAGFIAFIDRENLRRYTQAGVSCLGQDFYTLAPDIFCRVDVGVCFVPATQTLEDRLADSIAGVNVSTRRTCLAGVVSRYSNELAPVPIALVFELGTDAVPALREDRSVQSRFLPHVPARLFDCSFG